MALKSAEAKYATTAFNSKWKYETGISRRRPRSVEDAELGH